MRQGEHLDLALDIAVVEVDLEEEAVELRLGQWVDALVLVRVLRRDHEERIGEAVLPAVDRDVALLHRLEHRRLRPRRRPVHFVCEDDVREDRAGEEDVLAELRHHLADDVGRRRVGGELDPLERRAQDVGHRA